MLKRKYVSLLLVLIWMIYAVIPVYAEKDIQVFVKGTLIEFDSPPLIRDGRLLVPMRSIFEALGANINWDSTQKKVTAVKDSTIIVLTVNNNTAEINEKAILLETIPMIINNQMLIPLRFVGEALGVKVSWDEHSRIVTVSEKLLCDVEREVISVVRQFITSTNQKDLDALNNVLTKNYIKEEFGSEEELKSYLEKSSEGIIGLSESVLYEMRDSHAVVYFMAYEEGEIKKRYFSGYMILEQIGGRWLIDWINENERNDIEELAIPTVLMKTKRCVEIAEGVEDSVLTTMQQYKGAIEEGNRDNIYETMDENLRNYFLEREDDFESSLEPILLENFIAEVVQTNEEISYVKVSFEINKEDKETIDLKYLFMLKNTELGWKIYDYYWFVNPLPTDV